LGFFGFVFFFDFSHPILLSTVLIMGGGGGAARPGQVEVTVSRSALTSYRSGGIKTVGDKKIKEKGRGPSKDDPVFTSIWKRGENEPIYGLGWE
jgi:hypothetical protein